jgi:hypothetical protein
MKSIVLTPEEGAFLLQLLNLSPFKGLSSARLVMSVSEKLADAGAVLAQPLTTAELQAKLVGVGQEKKCDAGT